MDRSRSPAAFPIGARVPAPGASAAQRLVIGARVPAPGAPGPGSLCCRFRLKYVYIYWWNIAFTTDVACFFVVDFSLTKFDFVLVMIYSVFI